MVCKLTKLTPHPRVQRTGQCCGRAIGRGLLLGLRGHLPLLRAHATLLVPHAALWRRLLYPAVHHMLLLLLRMNLLRMNLRCLHVMVLGLMVSHVVVPHRGLTRVQRWTPAGTQHALSHSRGLQLATCINHGGLMAIRWASIAHVHITWTIRSVYPVSVHLLLLCPVVGRVSNIHPVVGWESRVWHALRRLSARWRSTVMMRRDPLPQSDDIRISSAGIWVLNSSSALRYLHSCSIVLMLVWMLCRYHSSIPKIWHVGVGEV